MFSYPNPTTSHSVVVFTIDQADEATLMIRDILGRTVQLLKDNAVAVGRHQFAIDSDGLSPGIYSMTLYLRDELRMTQFVVD